MVLFAVAAQSNNNKTASMAQIEKISKQNVKSNSSNRGIMNCKRKNCSKKLTLDINGTSVVLLKYE